MGQKISPTIASKSPFYQHLFFRPPRQLLLLSELSSRGLSSSESTPNPKSESALQSFLIHRQ